MNVGNTRARLPQATPIPATADDGGAQGDSLLQRAQESQAEQTALIETSPLESQYRAALAAHVEAKGDQVGRIEDRLEALIAQQTNKLTDLQDHRPGRISFPSTKQAWQQRVQWQQAVLNRLADRLEAVREIRDGMGLHGPKLEELAERKLRSERPGLAADWDDAREAQREHQAMQRRQEQQKRRRSQVASEGVGLSLGLGLSHER